MVSYADVFRNPETGEPNTKAGWIEFFRDRHGDIEDAKTKLLFLADEEGFEVETEDIEAVTDEPPSATFQ